MCAFRAVCNITDNLFCPLTYPGLEGIKRHASESFLRTIGYGDWHTFPTSPWYAPHWRLNATHLRNAVYNLLGVDYVLPFESFWNSRFNFSWNVDRIRRNRSARAKSRGISNANPVWPGDG